MTAIEGTKQVFSVPMKYPSEIKVAQEKMLPFWPIKSPKRKRAVDWEAVLTARCAYSQYILNTGRPVIEQNKLVAARPMKR